MRGIAALAPVLLLLRTLPVERGGEGVCGQHGVAVGPSRRLLLLVVRPAVPVALATYLERRGEHYVGLISASVETERVGDIFGDEDLHRVSPLGRKWGGLWGLGIERAAHFLIQEAIQVQWIEYVAPQEEIGG